MICALSGRPAYRRATFSLATLALLTACKEEPQEASAPVARVATFADGVWSIEELPEASFSPANSVMTTDPQGSPYALRVFGNDVLLGRWSGSAWSSETLAEINYETAGEDQLVSGIMRVNSQGGIFALFVTVNSILYSVTPTGTGHIVSLVEDASPVCYDVLVRADDTGYFLLTDPDAQITSLGIVDALGQLTREQIYAQDSCGALAESPEEGVIGAALLMYNYEEGSNMARLVEKRDGEEWRSTDIVLSGVYSCSSCYLPQLEYRSDGRAISLIVDGAQVAYAALQQEDSTFSLSPLTGIGKSWQMTALKRSTTGTVYAAYVQAQAELGLFSSGATSESVQFLESGAGLMTPRLFLGASGRVISYFDEAGLEVIRPGEPAAELVDATVGVGGYFGAFLSSDAQGGIQVFYSESHLE